MHKVNNFVPDSPTGEDEKEYIWLAGSTFYDINATCSNGTLPCHLGHSKCFSLENACVYDTEGDGTLTQCGNGAHLKLCRYMGCPTSTYKCPMSYCIPYWMLCNGLIDCPDGEDEAHCPLSRCPPGYFRCKGEVICLHMKYRCDGIIHCNLHNDDEKACLSVMPDCPAQCSCRLHSVMCSEQGSNQMVRAMKNQSSLTQWKRQLHIVTLPHSDVTLLSKQFAYLPLLKYLDVSHNKLIHLEANTLHYSVLLLFLDVSFNQITFISLASFAKLKNLKFFNISYNMLQTFSMGYFAHHSSVTFIDASFNEITNIDYIFRNKELKISSLNIVGNKIGLMDDLEHANILIDILLTEQLGLCCLLRSIPTCGLNNSQGYDSCRYLLPQNFKSIYWSCGTLIFLTLTMCQLLFTFRTIFGMQRNRQESSIWNSTNLIHQNILISYLLQGTYIISNITADMSFQNAFPSQKQNWLDHHYCFTLRVISLTNPFQSALLHFLLCVHFVKGIRAHFDSTAINIVVNFCVLFSWCITLPISILVSYYLQKRDLYVNDNHGICSGFQGLFFPLFTLSSITNNVYILYFIAVQIASSVCYIFIRNIMIRTKEQSQRMKYSKQEKQFFVRIFVTVSFWIIATLVYICFVCMEKRQLMITMFHDAFVSAQVVFNNILLIVQYSHSH